MRYNKFLIRNFKGIKDLTINLNKEPKSKVFTLVGLNESGKTSILEAVNFFQELHPLKDRHKLIPKSEKINFNDSISVTAEIGVDAMDNENIIKFAKSLGYKDIKPLANINITKSYFFEISNFKSHTSLWSIELFGQKSKARKLMKIQHSDDKESDGKK